MNSVRTFHTTLVIDDAQDKALSACALLMSSMKRKIFAKTQTEDVDKCEMQTAFINKFGISRRQFHAAWSEVKALVESNLSNLSNHIDELDSKIKSTRKIISDIKKREVSPKGKSEHKYKKQCRNQRKSLYFLNSKLHNQETKLNHLKADFKAKRVRVAFGTKKLFKAQYNLEENKFEDHQEWYEAWNHARNNQFYLIGSHDESAGNQMCQMTENTDGTFDIWLRLPDALKTKHGKHMHIQNVSFTYGYEAVHTAVTENLERSRIPVKDKEGRKLRGQAISYRFLKAENGKWYFYAMLDIPAPETISKKYAYGVIGIDINQDHLAVTETDRFGNPIESKNFACNTYGASSDQAIQIIGEAAKQIIEWAVKVQKPVVLEDLDFKKKKMQLQEYSPKAARQLSSFAYSAIIRIIKSRAYRFGIETFQVNPAFTSIIGRIKFADRYGLTVHQGAALAIGRRKMGLSERPPKSSDVTVRTNTNAYVTFDSPVRMSWKPTWYWWRSALKGLQSAVAPHQRKRKLSSQSQETKVGRDEKFPLFLGEIPKRRRHNGSGADPQASKLADTEISSSIPSSEYSSIF